MITRFSNEYFAWGDKVWYKKHLWSKPKLAIIVGNTCPNVKIKLANGLLSHYSIEEIQEALVWYKKWINCRTIFNLDKSKVWDEIYSQWILVHPHQLTLYKK